jgi:hypothetical protein
MHDLLIKQMSYYFRINENSFRLIKPDTRLMNKLMARFMDDKVFITRENGFPELKEEPELFVFDNFIEGYHLLMVELTDMAVESVNLVIPENDEAESIYITGGFSRNPLFTKLIASSFPDKRVFTSGLSNATALGAASVVLQSINLDTSVIPDLGLVEVRL